MRPIMSVVIPIHNEANTVDSTARSMVKALKSRFKSFELIFAENGSTDGTKERLAKLAKTLPGLRVVSIPEPNYGGAMRAGYLAAKGTYLCNASMDWFDIDFIASSVPALKDADLVVGTKARHGNDQRPLTRVIVSKGYNVFLRAIFGLRVSDTHSINIYRTDAIVPIIKRCVMDWSVFPSEVIIRAQRSKLRLVERDIAVHEKRARKKSLRKRIIRAAVGLAKLRLILWKETLTGNRR